MEKLIEQIKIKGFKPMSFQVYNYMDDNGYLTEMEVIFKEKFGIEDFELINLNLSENEKNGLKYRTKSVTSRFYNLKKFVEYKIQEDMNKPKSKLFILKDDGKVFLVKFKDFDLLSLI
jgi:hypothetical protein